MDIPLQQGEYLWMIRLHNGQLHFVAGLSIANALTALQTDLEGVKRYMPIRYQATEPQTEERKQEIQAKREAALVKAREVKNAERKREEHA